MFLIVAHYYLAICVPLISFNIFTIALRFVFIEYHYCNIIMAFYYSNQYALSLQVCECFEGYFGSECSYFCAHGTVKDTMTCTCNPCYTGFECNSECSGNGVCDGGECFCYHQENGAYLGPLCEFKGCPGLDGSCNGHGACNSATQECSCYPGWAGEDCSIPDCPGTPSCSGLHTIVNGLPLSRE